MHTIDSLIAQYLIILSILIVGYVFVKLPYGLRKRFVIEAIIGGLLTVALAKFGSKLFYDPRPFVVGHSVPYFPHGNDNGFPSDHTLLASFLGFLVLRYNKLWGYALLFVAVAIGLARVIAGVHHLIDIAGAFLCAGISVLLIYLIRSHLQKRPPVAAR